MAAADGDDSLYPIAVLIDELRNEDVQVPAATAGALLWLGGLRPWPRWVTEARETGARHSGQSAAAFHARALT